MNYDKLIFLDIDGVIALSHDPEFEKKLFLAGKFYPFEQSCVSVLNKIIEKTDAEIILSSSWRTILKLDELDNIFTENKVIKSPIDITPTGQLNRSLEIQAFISKHKIKKFVIIDDMDIEGYDKNFVKVDADTGLTEQHFSKIIEKLL